MNKLKTGKYGLWAVVVFGCFANFAHNEYGLTIVDLALIFLAILFLSESILNKLNKRSTYLVLESFFISLFLTSWIFKMMHWPGAGPLLICSGGLISILYINQGISQFKKIGAENRNARFLTLFVYLVIVLGFTGWIFKVQHWPGARPMLMIDMFLFPLVSILALFKYKIDDELIYFTKYLRQLKGNVALVFVIFTIIVTYRALGAVNLSPHFYSLSEPPMQAELRSNAKFGGEKERLIHDKYKLGYYQFRQNRQKAE